MGELAGAPFAWLPLDKEGGISASDKVIVPADATDLLVLCHGWKNDQGSAATLYGGMLRGTGMFGPEGRESAGRRFFSIGVSWPSLKYAANPILVEAGSGDGTSASSSAQGGSDLDGDVLAEQARSFAAAIEMRHADDFVRMSISASGGGGAADDFIGLVRDHLTAAPAQADIVEEHAELLSSRGADLVHEFANGGFRHPALVGLQEGGRAANASGRGGASVDVPRWRLLSGGRAAIASLLNQATYYEMKARAGTVGNGLAGVLDALLKSRLRVHLVGHSFGGRLACAAALGSEPASLIILQGALSHNALGIDVGSGTLQGAFRPIIDHRRVEGPIVVSHTRNDTAVGLYYALASTWSGDRTSGLGLGAVVGGPDDPHGGMGANGALSLRETEARTLVAETGSSLSFEPGKVSNVLADQIIRDHNDVSNLEVGALIRCAVLQQGHAKGAALHPETARPMRHPTCPRAPVVPG